MQKEPLLWSFPSLFGGSASAIIVACCASVFSLVHVRFVQLRERRLHRLRSPEGQRVSRLPLPGLRICF